MKISSLAITLILLCSQLTAQQFEWAKSYGSTEADISYFNKADNEGNVYVTGSFKGEIDFDDSGVYHFVSEGEEDLFLLKLNTNGDIQWAKTIGGKLIDKGVSITIDHDNNIYVTGDFQSADVDFDGTGVNNVSAQGNEDAFLIKYDSDGQFLRLDIFASPAKEAGISLDIDTENNLLLTGFFGAVVDFDPGVGVANLQSAGSIDGFVLKLDSAGNFIWAKGFNGTDWVKGLFIQGDSQDNYYISGYFRSSADFNPNPDAEYLLEAVGLRDFYIVKLDKDGDFLWAGAVGSLEEDRAISLAVDTNDDLYLGGYFGNQADFDIGEGEHILTSNGGADAYLMKLTKDGEFDWVQQFGAAGDDRIREVKLNNEDEIYVAGNFQNTVDFDLSSNTNEQTSNGNSDVFLLKLDAEANYLWSKTLGGPAIDEVFSMSLGNDNTLCLSGIFTTEVDFDFGANTHTLSSNGAKDIFTMKVLDNTAVATMDIKTNYNMSVFPNPSSGIIQFRSKTEGKADNWIIYSLSGQKRASGLFENDMSINLLGLEAGVYLIELLNGSKRSLATKIVIQ